MYIKNASNRDAKLQIGNRYAIKRMFDWGYQNGVQLASFFKDGEFFQHLPVLTTLFYIDGEFNTKYLRGTSLTTLELREFRKFALDLSDISAITTLTSLKLYSDLLKGDAVSLAALTSLSTLQIAYCSGLGNCTLESILVGMLNNGRVSGDLDCNIYRNTNPITFHDVQPTSSQHYIATFSSGSISVSLNSSVVATYDGSTWTYNN